MNTRSQESVRQECETAFNGGDRDWMVRQFLAALAKVGAFLEGMPDARAARLVAAWRAFHPRNPKGVDLYMKSLFKGRPSVYKRGEPDEPSGTRAR